MFGGPHQKDEVNRDEQSGWSKKSRTKTYSKVLAAQAAAALMHECLHGNQKTLGITLDTADFVRHVPTFLSPSFSVQKRRSCAFTNAGFPVF
jgi:hypothetical protein